MADDDEDGTVDRGVERLRGASDDRDAVQLHEELVPALEAAPEPRSEEDADGWWLGPSGWAVAARHRDITTRVVSKLYCVVECESRDHTARVIIRDILTP